MLNCRVIFQASIGLCLPFQLLQGLIMSKQQTSLFRKVWSRWM
ncbi:MAG: hypothetical protein ACI8SJ_001757, partial [Shewanella sp.]